MRFLNILNLGAGVQSTCLYLMSIRQDEPLHVPRFDYAIFADTKNETGATYRHLDWLIALGGPPILVRSRGDLFHDLFHGFERTSRSGEPSIGHKSIPAFVRKQDGTQGLLGRQCTQVYKVYTVEDTVKREIVGVQKYHKFPDDVEVRQFFGLSYDEPGRIIRTKARVLKAGWSVPRFPLFDLYMTRFDCDRYNEEHIPHAVPRSACVGCPLRDNIGWRDLRDNSPAEFEKACRIDEALRHPDSVCNRGLDGTPYLHRSMVPLRDADLSVDPKRFDQYTSGLALECEGLCGL